jgi:histone H3/H4
MNYYITETVSEAKQYRDYARKSTIDVADIRLAIGSKSCDTFTRPLPMSSIR